MAEPISAEELAAIVLDSSTTASPFSAVCSNPPYQIGPGRNSQVYGHFYWIAHRLSRFVTMIFPTGWQDSSPSGPNSHIYSFLKSDQSLKLVDNYYEQSESPVVVFNGVGTGGVNILLRDSEYDSHLTHLSEYGKPVAERDFSHQTFWSSRSEEIFEKLRQWSFQSGCATMDKTVTSRGFGVNTYVTTDKQREDYSYVALEPADDSIPLWSRVSGSSKYDWHWLGRDYPKLKPEKLDKFKVCWVKMNAPTNWRKTKILQPGEIYSDTFISAMFDSKQHAENFVTYFTTKLYRFTISETVTTWSAMPNAHRHTPDLSAVRNDRSGAIGWDSEWTDADLRRVFEGVLTDDDWQYIEDTASKSDAKNLTQRI